MRRLFVFLALGIVGIMIGGIVTPHNRDSRHSMSASPMSTATHPMDSEGTMANMDLPDYLVNAPERVYAAYEFAVAHPEDLQYQPCYCGCSRMGHRNNLDCYITPQTLLTRWITFDRHASVCGVCIDITHDVARLKSEGKTPLEIRHYIDANYAKFGPSTNTPLPPLS